MRITPISITATNMAKATAARSFGPDDRGNPPVSDMRSLRKRSAEPAMTAAADRKRTGPKAFTPT
jgi:hypothetical protein